MSNLQIQPHPFAHIMDAPYTYVSMSYPEDREDTNTDRKDKGQIFTTNTSAGTCDCCNAGITIAVYIRGASGIFKVGSTCAKKATQSPKVLDIIKTQTNKRNADKRNQKLQADMIQADAWIAQNTSTIAALPHPKGFNGLTLLDYIQWYRKNSGHAKFISTYNDVRKSIV